jgi:LmbE family N-acetylglucosaminyl deacetylase
MARRILLLGAHTDDGEWGCGGSIHKWRRSGDDVTYVALSAAEESVRPEFPRDILRTEIFAGAALIGVPRERVRVLDFPVRHFPQHRQAILETLVKLRSEFDPDLVLVHATTDTHQDHETLNREAFRAFKRTSVLGFELPHNCRVSAPGYFSCLEDADIEAKVAALQAYQSQAWRAKDVRAILTGQAVVRGAQVGVGHAEAFEVIRWVER